MNKIFSRFIVLFPVLLLIISCTSARYLESDLISDPFPDAQAELRKVIESIAEDIETANIEGLQAMHLNSSKFTKFGPRSFDRQDVARTNDSEAAFFSSISNMNYEIRDLKIDVFGDIGIVTYYPYVSFVKDGEKREVNGRQTLVFLKTESGWKIVHEHGTIRK
ncbi:MAG: nuclear transport factor 2 family protein [Gammaproteobacteria bacterium]|nr:nuclear transport factor 2 family protein [Gammaproteobacteria bacterium]